MLLLHTACMLTIPSLLHTLQPHMSCMHCSPSRCCMIPSCNPHSCSVHQSLHIFRCHTMSTMSVPSSPRTFPSRKAHIPILHPSSSRRLVHIVCMLTMLPLLHTLQPHSSCMHCSRCRCCMIPSCNPHSCSVHQSLHIFRCHTMSTKSVPSSPRTFPSRKAHIPILLPSSSRRLVHIDVSNTHLR